MLEAIDILTRSFGCTALLMSATCPDFLPYMCKNAHITEINDNYKQHYNQFKRVSAKYVGKKTNDEIVKCIDFNSQVLIVVNSRKNAKEMFEALPKCCNKYHLSTLMTPEHRKRVLREIKNRLENKLPCIVVSTQLIECGVDLDFSTVFRSLAGIDSIVQAGGRCNRGGEQPNPKFIIFESQNDPQKGDIPIYKSIARTICEKVNASNSGDVFDLCNVMEYFTEILNFKSAEMDKKELISLFNIGGATKPSDFSIVNYLKFDFAECNNRFSYIEETKTYDIIINTDKEVNALIENVRKGIKTKNTFRRLAQYTVSVYKYEYEALAQNLNKLLPEDDRRYVLVNNFDYKSDTGLVMESELNDAILVC